MIEKLDGAKDFQEEYPVKLFFHKNSKVTDLATSLLMGLGFALMISRQKKFKNKMYLRGSFNIVLGVFFLIFGFTGKRILKQVASVSLNSYQRSFQPFIKDNVSLDYEGILPVLSIKEKNPFLEGFYHGYYLEKQITILRDNLFIPKVEKKHIKIVEECEKLIPKKFLDEMQGIVNGYNLKIKQISRFYNSLTLQELILFHMLPELEQFNLEDSFSTSSNMACTVVLSHDKELGFIMGRNLDWHTKGVMGSYTLLVRREGQNKTTLNLTLPGMVGVLTGMNDQGLCVAINVCKGTINSFDGMPSLLFNRHCLESKSSIEEVKELTELERPMGAYHLSMADSTGAAVVHFYQDNNKDYWRKFENDPIVTTNYRYGSYGKANPTSKDSELREAAIEKSLNENESQNVLNRTEKALSLPRVNNIKTAHQLIMFPKTKSMNVKFDNGWAANSPSVNVTI